MAAKLASGYIDLTVKYSSAMKQITSDMTGLQTTAKKAGTQAGKNLTDALVSQTAKGGQQASKRFFDEFRSPAERAGAIVGLAVGKTIGGGIRVGIGTVNIAQALGSRLMSGATSVGRNVGRTLGNTITSALTTSLKGLGLGGGLAAAGGLGGILFAGFDRLKNIDTAKFKLKALGNTAEDVQKIMNSALESVQGTSFSLDQAANAAASAVAAGVKPGQQLTDYLKSVADTAAIAGTSFDDMAHIFNKVRTQNKAYTDDLQMLSDRGVPIFQWLQEQYNVTGADLSKMVEDGKVDAAAFEQAINTHIGGAALKMGDSFEGSVEKAKAAISRLGEAILSPVFGQASGGIGGLTESIDKFTKWINDHRPEVIQFFTDVGVAAVTVAQDVVKSFGEMMRAAGDFTHGLGTVLDTLGFDEGAKLQAAGDNLNTIGDRLIATVPKFDIAKDKVRGWGGALKEAAENAQGAQGAVTGAGTALGALPAKKVVDINVTGDAESKVAGIGDALGKLTQQPWKLDLTVSGTSTATDAVAPSFDGVTILPDNPLGMDSRGFIGGGTLFGGGTQGGQGDRFGLQDRIAAEGAAPIFGGPGAQAQRRGASGTQDTSAGPIRLNSSSTPIAPPLQGNFGAEGWRPTVASVVDAYGAPYGVTPANRQLWIDAIVKQIQTESGGNPGADNPTDSNGRGGTQHVSGLLQYLPETYAANNITGRPYTDPIGQIAGVLKRAPKNPDGSPATTGRWAIGQGHGWALGGPVTGPGGPTQDQILAWLSDGEHVWTAQEVAAVGGQEKMMQLRSMAQAGTLTPDAVGAPQASAAGRTQGYIPAGAGYSGKTGGGIAGSFINMGAEGINGLIDQAASAASSAGSGAANAFAPGAGAAASLAIQMGAQAAKRGVQWGADMANIGVGALSEILLPFGAPRWLTDVDPTSFIPQPRSQPAAVTTAEQSAVDPWTTQHGLGQGAAPGPLGPPPLSAMPWADTMQDATNAPVADVDPTINGGNDYSVHLENVTVKDVNELQRQLDDKQRLQMMRNGGRPSMGTR